METDTATLDPIFAGTQVPADDPPPLRRLPNAPPVLSLAGHGRAMDWIPWQERSWLYARDAVAWALGTPCMRVHGGVNRDTGSRSIIELHPIIATRGHARARALDPT